MAVFQHALTLPNDRVNYGFSLQAHHQQIVATPAAQAPVAAQFPPAMQAPAAAQAPVAAQASADEAERNRKYQATLQLAQRLLGQLQQKPGNQP